MEYRIGELCRILNMRAHVIRFYEKKGIVSPERAEWSQFRVYNEFDIRLLVSAKTYRSLGYSLDDTVRILRNQSGLDSHEIYRERLEAIERELAQLKEQKKQLTLLQKDQTFAEKHLDNWTEVSLPAINWLYSFDEERVVHEPLDAPLLARMNEHSAKILLMAKLEEQGLHETGTLHYDWGYAMTDEDTAYIKEVERKGFVHIEAQRYLAKSCIVDRECKIKRPMFDALYAAASACGRRIAKDAPVLVKLLLGYHKNTQNGYLICYLPVEAKD